MGQLDHISNNFFKVVFILDQFLLNQRCINGFRLNFKVVVILGLFLRNAITLLHHRCEDFTISTC